MSRIKSKLVLKSTAHDMFEIAKVVNTLKHGVPGDSLTREGVDKLLKDHFIQIDRGTFTVEIVNGRE